MLYLGLGSNAGDREDNLRHSILLIEERVGSVAVCSDVIETEPWGYRSNNPYLNQVIGVESKKNPEEILLITQDIERRLGRTQKSISGVYNDRTVDIDLLIWDDRVVNQPHLQIPHPLMHLRSFVLEPLSSIAPDLVHPLLKKSMTDLYLSQQNDK